MKSFKQGCDKSNGNFHGLLSWKSLLPTLRDFLKLTWKHRLNEYPTRKIGCANTHAQCPHTGHGPWCQNPASIALLIIMPFPHLTSVALFLQILPLHTAFSDIPTHLNRFHLNGDAYAKGSRRP